MLYKRQVALLFFLLLTVSVCVAQLKAGDLAPKPHITNWIENVSKDTSLENKFIVLDFWATWCAPCLESVPHINKLVEKNKRNRNLVFLSVTDEKVSRVRSLLSRVAFASTVITDTTGKIQSQYKINSIPYCIMIDAKGKIQWAGKPKDLTDEIIQQVLRYDTVSTANAESKTSEIPATFKSSRSVYDSLRTKYYTNIDDNDIEEYFAFGPMQHTKYGSRFSSSLNTKFSQCALGVDLKDEISSLLKVSPIQVASPKDLWDNYISYCYKSKTKVTDNDLLKRILDRAGLALETKDSLQDILVLTVADTSLLYRDLETNARVMHTSSSDTYVAIGNNSLQALTNQLENSLSQLIVLEHVDEFKRDNLNMTVMFNNFQALEKSLKYYGIKVVKSKRILPFYIIKHK